MKNNSAKIRVAIFTDNYWPSNGGVENAIRQICSISNNNTDIIVHTTSKKIVFSSLFLRTALSPSFNKYKDPDGTSVNPLNLTVIGRILLLPFLFWHFPFIKRFCAEYFFDHLYIFYRLAFSKQVFKAISSSDIVYNFSTSHLAILVTEIANSQIKKLIHSPFIHFGRWGDSPKQLRCYSKASIFIAPTKHYADMILKYVPNIKGKIAIIPPITDNRISNMKKPTLIPKNREFILFLARDEKHKGLSLLLDAYEKAYVDTLLVIAGPNRQKINTKKNCYNIGAVSSEEKEWLLTNMRFLCVPSSDETFGIVYAEAMNHAKAIIALDIAPVNEIIKHNKTGILVSNNDINALANAIRILCLNNHLCLKMGENGKQEFKNRFSTNLIKKKILHFLNTNP